MTPADKTMFEIYREADYGRQYRIVFFTDLDEHNKETEINRAVAGDHFYDGFILDLRKEDGVKKLNEIVGRLNRGESLNSDMVESELRAAAVLAD